MTVLRQSIPLHFSFASYVAGPNICRSSHTEILGKCPQLGHGLISSSRMMENLPFDLDFSIWPPVPALSLCGWSCKHWTVRSRCGHRTADMPLGRPGQCRCFRSKRLIRCSRILNPERVGVCGRAVARHVWGFDYWVCSSSAFLVDAKIADFGSALFSYTSMDLPVACDNSLWSMVCRAVSSL